jgi:hypothetical protein
MLSSISFPIAPVGTADPGTYYVGLQPTTNGRTNNLYGNPRLSYQPSTGTLVLDSITVGNNVNANNLNITGAVTSNLTVQGYTVLQQTSEVVNTVTTSTSGLFNYNFVTGAIFYHTSVTGSITANFTNVPTTNNRTNLITIVIAQGSSPYSITGVQINSTQQVIKYPNAAIPTAVANRTEFWTFDLLRVNNSWVVTASMTSYG